MVYDSDFYTTRRPYRSSPAYSSYSSSKREIPWEKVPFVPRPSLVPDPVTAFGKRPSKPNEFQRPEKRSILHPEERAKIKPKAYLEPIQPYKSARDKNRDKIFSDILRRELAPNAENMDVVLPRLHKVAECPDLPYKRKMVAYSDLPPSPRHYIVSDIYPDRSARQAEEVYSYSYNSSSDSSSNRYGDPYSRPQVRSSSTVESVTRSSTGGPGGYSYTSERSSRSRGDGPGGYHSSYSSTTSGNLPGGTSYRHWSYRV